MKRVLAIQLYERPLGGGGCVAAWMLEGLADDYDVSVVTWDAPEVAELNRTFGTRLRRERIQWHGVNRFVRLVLKLLPFRLALLRMHILMATARRHYRAGQFDLVIGTINEFDVGVPAIQYIHYPWASLPRPETDYRWYHLGFLLRLYRSACARLSGYRNEGVAGNVTLVNSDWTGRLFSARYRTPTMTVYPPVPGGFPAIPHDRRERAFVCLGRISPEKEIGKIMVILAGVRERGHDINLHVVGPVSDRAYMSRISRLCEPHRHWITFHHDLPRAELVELVAHCRYGIHGMAAEHFGIAPAELQRAGCITFVADDGGPVEIVGHDERLIYHSIEDAIQKITMVLERPDLEQDLKVAVAKRGEWFSEDRFVAEIRRIVAAQLGESRSADNSLLSVSTLEPISESKR